MTAGMDRARQRGMALVIVLWLVLLLSVMAAGHSLNVHADSLLASRQLGLSQARALADAGIRRAILDLLEGAPRPVNGEPAEIEINGETIIVSVRDARGLVDLNAAGPELLGTLLTLAGASDAERNRIVDAILDWRDVDNLTHLNGAEDDEYRATGVAWTARDGAFVSVDELRYVRGMRPDVFAAVLPYITVYSGQAALEPEFAPPRLAAAAFGESFAEPVDVSAFEVPEARAATGPRSGTYHVRAVARRAAEASAALEAVVRVSGRRERPYLVLEWRDVAQDPGLPPQVDGQ